MIDIDQIRKIYKQRIVKNIGNLDPETIKQTKQVIEETYVK